MIASGGILAACVGLFALGMLAGIVATLTIIWADGDRRGFILDPVDPQPRQRRR